MGWESEYETHILDIITDFFQKRGGDMICWWLRPQKGAAARIKRSIFGKRDWFAENRTAVRSLQLTRMPVTVFDIKGIPGHRRERIEAVVVAGEEHAEGPHEPWIAADPLKS